jgi:phage FluMu protein Com
MAIAFQCSQCEATLKVADTSAGKKCKCPTCSAVNVIPGGNDEAAEDAPSTRSAAARIATAPTRPPKTAAASNPDAEEPRSKVKKSVAKKGGNKMMLLIGGAVLLCGLALFGCVGLGGGGFAIWYFFLSDPLREDTRYFPNNSNLVVAVRVDDLRSSEFYTTIKSDLGKVIMEKSEGAIEDEIGIPLDNIDRIVAAGITEGNDTVVVIHTKKSVQAVDMITAMRKKNAAASFTETRANGKTINERNTQFPGQNSMSFCVVDSKLVLMGNASVLKTVLERDKAPDLSEKMKTAMKAADFKKTMTLVAVDMDANKNTMPVGGMPFGGNNTMPPPVSMVIALQVDKDIVSTTTMTFKDAKAAEDAKAKVEQALTQMRTSPLLRDMPSDLFDTKMRVSGKDLIADTTVKGATVSKLLRKFMDNFGGAGAAPFGQQR